MYAYAYVLMYTYVCTRMYEIRMYVCVYTCVSVCVDTYHLPRMPHDMMTCIHGEMCVNAKVLKET